LSIKTGPLPNKILFSLLFILLVELSLFAKTAESPETFKRVLVLNSYHEGYKWSDDIVKGIKTGLASNEDLIEIQIEYMDTQRVTDREYLTSLKTLYSYKFRDSQFDIILSSDDTAFDFLLLYGEELFPDIPIVFCGVNHFDEKRITENRQITGVVEGYDIKSTLETALMLHPETETMYYIDDDTTTGKAIMKEFQLVVPEFEDRLDFIRLDGRNLDLIEEKAKTLPDTSLIIFLIYFQDNQGTYFPYDSAISRLREASPVPIYGVWDFHLGYGIMGGKLTSGYYQGKMAADLALRVLAGELAETIPVLTENTNIYKFDGRELKRFGIDVVELPKNSTIINFEGPLKKQILILNSYDKGFKWTLDLEEGIKDSLKDHLQNIEFSYEFMDVKSNPDPGYIQPLYEFLKMKYAQKNFDAIIVTDDDAFLFMTKYHSIIARDAPLFFCGVNYYEEGMIEPSQNTTGVVESYDMASTLDLALNLNPDTKKIVIINDTTLTGVANRKNLEKLIPNYTDRVDFEFWSELNMTEIQKQLRTLQQGTIILLLTFNRDRSYNDFSYDESISLISEASKVPIYGLWDFYLGNGLLGGMLISGFSQGQMVGEQVSRYLQGTAIADIPVVTASPNRYMFDKQQLVRFGIKNASLPEDSYLINMPGTIKDFINENKMLLFMILSLMVIISLLFQNVRLAKASEKKEKVSALTDPLTGIPNRRAGLQHAKRLFEACSKNGNSFTICFSDVNGLKIVNDTFGHLSGDALIQTISSVFSENIRKEDLVSRMGGDEFLLTFYDINISQMQEIWKRIEKDIDTINEKRIAPYTLSVCAGFAEFEPKRFKSIYEMIEAADTEMYRNKSLFKKSQASRTKKQEQ
jgi:diguanylate cyclase (GGDEF)-like protein